MGVKAWSVESELVFRQQELFCDRHPQNLIDANLDQASQTLQVRLAEVLRLGSTDGHNDLIAKPMLILLKNLEVFFRDLRRKDDVGSELHVDRFIAGRT